MRVFKFFLCVTAVLLFALLMMLIDRDEAGKGTQKASAATVQTVSTAEQTAKAAKCSKLIDKTHGTVWRSYDASSSGATIEVGSAFVQSSFEDKEAVAAIFRCKFTDGRMDNSVPIIMFVDWRTHRDLANWTPELGLEVKDN